MSTTPRTEGVGTAETRGAFDKKARVLVVDDTAQNLEFMEAILRPLTDVEVVLCRGAKDTVVALQQPDFAVALLDVYMPEMSGFELARSMRTEQRTKDIPIIFVTAAMPTSQVLLEGYENGAVDILFKPLDPRVVKSKVEVFKALYSARRALELSNERILAAKHDAERAGQLKDRFLANVSHEIRTPIQAIIGLADSVRREETLAGRESLLRSIDENASYLSHLLGNILDVSRLESGALHPSAPSSFSFHELEAFLHAMFGAKAREKGLSLRFEATPDIRTAHLRADEIHLKQILCNLVANALKFTQQGEVAVHASKAPDRNAIVVDVTDTGPGIPRAHRADVFLPFRQLASEHQDKLGGVGLGLSLSRGLAEASQGTLTCEDSTDSDEAGGAGAHFRLVFPVQWEADSGHDRVDKQSRNLISVEPPTTLQGLRILLAEDSPFISAFVARVLEEAGAQIELACDGQEAVEAMENGMFDVALIDLDMPLLSGKEVVQRARTRRYATATLVAFTATSAEEANRQAAAAGFDGAISKPVEKEALVRAIHLIHQRRSSKLAQKKQDRNRDSHAELTS